MTSTKIFQISLGVVALAAIAVGGYSILGQQNLEESPNQIVPPPPPSAAQNLPISENSSIAPKPPATNQTNPAPSSEASLSINTIQPNSIRVGEIVTITGKNFLGEHLWVYFAPREPVLENGYYLDIGSYIPKADRTNTSVSFRFAPEQFGYGSCNAIKYKNCDLSGRENPLLKQIPDGIYDVLLLKSPCGESFCKSNKVTVTVSN